MANSQLKIEMSFIWEIRLDTKEYWSIDEVNISGVLGAFDQEDSIASLIYEIVASDGVSVSANGYSALSEYGTFTVNNVGEFTYVLDEAKSQKLNEIAVTADIFAVKVTDSDGASYIQEVIFSITGSNDRPSNVTFKIAGTNDESTTVVTVNENATEGMSLQLDADDVDNSSSELVYSIKNINGVAYEDSPYAQILVVDNSNKTITVNGSLDFEIDPNISLVVAVTDNLSTEITETLVINLENYDEKPIVDLTKLNITSQEDAGTIQLISEISDILSPAYLEDDIVSLEIVGASNVGKGVHELDLTYGRLILDGFTLVYKPLITANSRFRKSSSRNRAVTSNI